ncbi:MAG: flagellar biosynthesis protein [Clostridium sp.]|nr:flagellar biosynthesis protein [Clostridium sp.]
MSFRVINGKAYPVGLIDDVSSTNKTGTLKKDKNDFQNLLNTEMTKDNGFVISGHAASRLKSRNINLNENDMKAINDGINKAEEKGAKDSVILYKNLTFIASIKNRTIITAVDKENSKQNVFTNVDSVVML